VKKEINVRYIKQELEQLKSFLESNQRNLQSFQGGDLQKKAQNSLEEIKGLIKTHGIEKDSVDILLKEVESIINNYREIRSTEEVKFRKKVVSSLILFSLFLTSIVGGHIYSSHQKEKLAKLEALEKLALEEARLKQLEEEAKERSKALKKLLLKGQIPAILQDNIVLREKDSGITVRAKILVDVTDEISGDIYIKKGDTAIGTIHSFDQDTGEVKINIEKVFSKKKNEAFKVSMVMNSADGTSNLSGRVFNKNGKHILGSFIAAFNSATLEAMSESFIDPLSDNEDLADSALSGAVISSIMEIQERIAEVYANDAKQNNINILHIPAGIPVLLSNVKDIDSTRSFEEHLEFADKTWSLATKIYELNEETGVIEEKIIPAKEIKREE